MIDLKSPSRRNVFSLLSIAGAVATVPAVAAAQEMSVEQQMEHHLNEYKRLAMLADPTITRWQGGVMGHPDALIALNICAFRSPAH
jgi:hypothetical protein